MISQNEKLVINLLLARRENYGLESISHRTGRYYDVAINGRDYVAVILPNSFEYYELRYHLADVQPDLCICQRHNAVLPIPTLHLESSNMAEPYALPERITDLKKQRWSESGFQCLLSLAILGVHSWVDYIETLPPTTRKRYRRRARELTKRPAKGGRPVGLRKRLRAKKRKGATDRPS